MGEGGVRERRIAPNQAALRQRFSLGAIMLREMILQKTQKFSGCRYRAWSIRKQILPICKSSFDFVLCLSGLVEARNLEIWASFRIAFKIFAQSSRDLQDMQVAVFHVIRVKGWHRRQKLTLRCFLSLFYTKCWHHCTVLNALVYVTARRDACWDELILRTKFTGLFLNW